MHVVTLSSLVAGACLLCTSQAQAQQSPVQPHFDLADFHAPLRIDNPYSAMKPRTRAVLHELEDGECKVNDVVVTDQVKHDFGGPYAGLAVRAVRDRVWADDACDGTRGLLLEDTTDWYGQDDHGNVWYFGEATVEFTYDAHGHRIDADRSGSWIAGQDGAKAGIVMHAKPMPGMYYRQEYLKGEAEDAARVERIGLTVTTGLGRFRDCVETRETTALTPGDVEYKFYCGNVGLVRVVSPNEDGGAETVTLAVLEP